MILNEAFEIKRLFDRIMEEADPKLSHQEKLAHATAKLDEKLGPEWRKLAKPHGLSIIQPEEGGQVKEDKAREFFDRVRKAMMDENMETGKLIDLTGLEEHLPKPHAPHAPRKQSFMDEIVVKIRRSG